MIKKLPANQVTEIIYTTDQLGQFVGVENWKEISKKMKKLFSALTELQATEKTIKNDTIKQILAGISEILATKEGIEQLLLKEIQIFHFPFGFELNSSEPLLYEEVYPNLLGGDALKGDGKIYVDSVDYLNSYCSLRQEVTMRPGETKAFLLSFFKKMVSSDAELVEALKNSAYDITDKNRFAYWYYPGIPHQIESIRHMLMDIMDNKFKRRDVLRIEIQE